MVSIANGGGLTASALSGLRAALPPGCDRGYSNSRACEIGLTTHAGVPYQSIVYLVDACTSPVAPVVERIPGRARASGGSP